MNGDLPEARIAGRHRAGSAWRAFAIAGGVGGAATVASWSLLVAFVIAGIGIGLGGLRVFRLYLGASDVRDGIPEAAPPAGDRVFSLRPRAAALGMLAVSLSSCFVVIRWPELLSTSAIALLALCAVLITVTFLVVFIRAAILRPQIVVTDCEIKLPRSAWSSDEISIALKEVRLRKWGPEASPILEISSIGHEDFDVGMTFLGEASFRELVSLLEHRVAMTRTRVTP